MKKFIWPIVGVLFIAFVVWLIMTPGRVKVSVYDGFASCIKESGAVFYGTFWCPYCQAQKAMFGSAAKLLPYVECSTPDGNSQLKVCEDASVTSYPTWVFADGTRKTGSIPLEELSSLTSCPLPIDA